MPVEVTVDRLQRGAGALLLAVTALSTACPHAPSAQKGTVSTRLSGAAYLSHAGELPAGKTVAIVSGGNADPAMFAEILA